MTENSMKNCLMCVVLIVVVGTLACAAYSAVGDESATGEQMAASPALKEAIAVINPASGSNCKGTVRFIQDGTMVKVIADLEGLTPGGKHGFHVHEFGDCTAPDATSAGSHYDAEGTKHHGRPEDTMKHSGDLGNIEADAGGKAHYEVTIQGVSIAGDHAPIIGRGVIVHAKADDFGQPVGNAGGRIGCGVIGIMKPAAK
jgi:Cu-Zn family superoxide dismutase